MPAATPCACSGAAASTPATTAGALGRPSAVRPMRQVARPRLLVTGTQSASRPCSPDAGLITMAAAAMLPPGALGGPRAERTPKGIAPTLQRTSAKILKAARTRATHLRTACTGKDASTCRTAAVTTPCAALPTPWSSAPPTVTSARRGATAAPRRAAFPTARHSPWTNAMPHWRTDASGTIGASARTRATRSADARGLPADPSARVAAQKSTQPSVRP
mmetsp:Transcript_39378/g.125650  ORF Transcript_39378/g.125650 Transcript_39378/m.125650 type:complete len:219 (+) Transcript_39378:629-1285(+)